MPRHEIVGVSLDGVKSQCACGFCESSLNVEEHVKFFTKGEIPPEVNQLKDLGRIIKEGWGKKLEEEYKEVVDKKVVDSNLFQEEIVRVLRLVEYEGPRKDVEEQLKNSLHGTRTFPKGVGNSWPKRGLRITATDLGRFPEVIEEARRVADPQAIKDLNSRIERLEMERDKALAREDELRLELNTYLKKFDESIGLRERLEESQNLVRELEEKLEDKNDFISLMDSQLRNLWCDGEVIA